ncbi:uncharacterized protein LOC135925156 isoform X1 [Gordionus sp. m RMFG-2023]|uniref:uncharacterized protein LOC135925156 isoform X1 n=2 Tax=Gordionus sp. m RMFG-2023 TaxID=3053472 RepID=UPI0031FCDEAF
MDLSDESIDIPAHKISLSRQNFPTFSSNSINYCDIADDAESSIPNPSVKLEFIKGPCSQMSQLFSPEVRKNLNRGWTAMDDNSFPLSDISCREPQSMSLINNKDKPPYSPTFRLPSIKVEKIECSNGFTINVAVQGQRSKPAILTYHDIGLNHVSQFQNFFAYDDMSIISKHFCVYHIDAPGQEEQAPTLNGSFDELESTPHQSASNTINSNDSTILYSNKNEDKISFTDNSKVFNDRKSLNNKSTENSGNWSSIFNGLWSAISPNLAYPTMDELAEMILDIMKYFGLKSFIGFGVGAGANILSRFTLKHGDKVEALFLVEANGNAAGWTEWSYQKLNSFYLRKNSLTNFTHEYLIWHHFGKVTPDKNSDLINAFKDYFLHHINNLNLASFIESYIRRTDLGICRNLNYGLDSSTISQNGNTNTNVKKANKNFSCPVMIIAGSESPHIEESEALYANLEPNDSSWLKVSNCGGMVLEERPDKVSEAFRLFIQGLGYIPYLSRASMSENKRADYQKYRSLSTNVYPNSSLKNLATDFDPSTNLAKQKLSLPIRPPLNFHKFNPTPPSPYLPHEHHRMAGNENNNESILKNKATTGKVDTNGISLNGNGNSKILRVVDVPYTPTDEENIPLSGIPSSSRNGIVENGHGMSPDVMA